MSRQFSMELADLADTINRTQQERRRGVPFMSKPYRYSTGSLPSCLTCGLGVKTVRVGHETDVVNFSAPPIPVSFKPCGHRIMLTVDELSALEERDRNPSITAKLSSDAAPVSRSPVRLYEVRTVHGEAYLAEGDVIESGDGWFTLWAGRSELSLRVPEADIRVVRQVDIAELDTTTETAQALEEQLAEARMWARHGYEIGQRHCSWSDHGVAPRWLTEGWPNNFDSCEHLQKAAEYDTAICRVLEVVAELEAADVHGSAWDANQEAARRIREVLRPSSPGNEPTVKP